jgi:hypothetical protein
LLMRDLASPSAITMRKSQVNLSSRSRIWQICFARADFNRSDMLPVEIIPKGFRPIAHGWPHSGLPWVVERHRHITLKGLWHRGVYATTLSGLYSLAPWTQGSSFYSQPWAMRRNSFGVKEGHYGAHMGSGSRPSRRHHSTGTAMF